MRVVVMVALASSPELAWTFLLRTFWALDSLEGFGFLFNMSKRVRVVLVVVSNILSPLEL